MTHKLQPTKSILWADSRICLWDACVAAAFGFTVWSDGWQGGRGWPITMKMTKTSSKCTKCPIVSAVCHLTVSGTKTTWLRTQLHEQLSQYIRLLKGRNCQLQSIIAESPSSSHEFEHDSDSDHRTDHKSYVSASIRDILKLCPSWQTRRGQFLEEITKLQCTLGAMSHIEVVQAGSLLLCSLWTIEVEVSEFW